MLRMYTIGVESAAASVLLLPAMWATIEGCRKNMTAVRRLMLMMMAVRKIEIHNQGGKGERA